MRPLILLSALLSTSCALLPTTGQGYGPCDVTSVLDGDTIHVRCFGVPDSVRLLSINTPEKNEPDYERATAALHKMIGNRQVTLRFKRPGYGQRDRYKRLLAYVFVGKRNLNVEMVRAGWTPYWKKYGKSRYDVAFKRAEAEAPRASAR